MAKVTIKANRFYEEPEPADDTSEVEALLKQNAELRKESGFYAGMLLTAGIAVALLLFAFLAAAGKG